MKLTTLAIHDFKALANCNLTNLDRVVVLAGENGSGKSSVMDAIRLTKVLVGSYADNANDRQEVLNELNLNVTSTGDLRRPLTRWTQRSAIKATFSFSESDRAYLRLHYATLAEGLAFRNASGAAGPPANQRRVTQSALGAARRDYVMTTEELESALSTDQQVEVTITPEISFPQVSAPKLLQVAFSVWDPGNLGAVIYHSANRVYPPRENTNAIQLATPDHLRNHATSSNSGKFSGLKAEIASIRAHELLVGGTTSSSDIETAIVQLFEYFLPNKRFGGLRFEAGKGFVADVILSNGKRHDIDDLSSGEREVIFGYLRLHSQRSKAGILLLDEPELHLHPLMAARLIGFLQNSVGLGQNQIIAASHSEHVVRAALETPDVGVFFLRSASNELFPDGTQAKRVVASDATALIGDLVGDYSKLVAGNPVLILEGERSEFDKRVVSTLFPSLAARYTILSVGSKSAARTLLGHIQTLLKQAGLSAPVFAIVDRDFDGEGFSNCASWDVYSIENYLIDFPSISKLVLMQSLVPIDCDVLNELKLCAAALVDALARKSVEQYANAVLRPLITVGSGGATDVAERIPLVAKNIEALAKTELSRTHLTVVETSRRLELQRALADGSWSAIFPGKDVLRSFATKFVKGISLDTFLSMLVSTMWNDRRQPIGMRRILEQTCGVDLSVDCTA